MFEALRAVRLFGAGVRLRDQGERERALEKAEKALELISRPHVNRRSAVGFTTAVNCFHLFVELAVPMGRLEDARQVLGEWLHLYDEMKLPPSEHPGLRAQEEWARSMAAQLDERLGPRGT